MAERARSGHTWNVATWCPPPGTDPKSGSFLSPPGSCCLKFQPTSMAPGGRKAPCIAVFGPTTASAWKFGDKIQCSGHEQEPEPSMSSQRQPTEGTFHSHEYIPSRHHAIDSIYPGGRKGNNYHRIPYTGVERSRLSQEATLSPGTSAGVCVSRDESQLCNYLTDKSCIDCLLGVDSQGKKY